jgi:formylmethanofuran dehydrogenase subunit A
MSQYDYHTRQHPQLNQIPAEFRDNDLKQCSISKDDNIDTPNGLMIERKLNANTKEYYIKEVTPGGIFHQLHGINNRIQVGDRLIKVNGKPVEEYLSLWDINHLLKTSSNVTVHVKRGGLHLQPQREWKPAEYTACNSMNRD